jgi:SAM-dependent methyltransferase
MYRAELFDRLGVRASGERVLDIGSFDSHWLSRQPARFRVGVDLDIQPSRSCHVLRGDGQQLPFADSTFDSVFAFDVIEHVDDDARFVAELVRVTRPGGEIMISTPNADLRILPRALTPWAHRRWGHARCTGYAPGELSALFAAAGAKDVQIRQLRAWTYLTFYLPLALVSRVSNAAARRAVAFVARIDSRWRTDGSRGYLLARVRA